MSGSLEARVERAVRLAARGTSARIGTPAVSVALLALAACSVLATAAWARWGSGAAASAFATSPARWGLAAAIVVDAVVALYRGFPAEPLQDGRRRRFPRRALREALRRAAELLTGVALLASLSARDVFEVQLARGERFTAGPEQFVGREPPRPWSAGPFGADLVVGEVEVAPSGSAPAVELQTGGATRHAGSWRPVWLGWDRFLRPAGWGWAIRYELLGSDGMPVETAFAKLELLPEGRTDAIRLATAPYRVHVQLGAEQPPDDAGRALRAVVYRGKTRVAERLLAPGQELRFEGWSLRFPEARRWVLLRIIRDPGFAIAAVAALLALAAVATPVTARRAA